MRRRPVQFLLAALMVLALLAVALFSGVLPGLGKRLSTPTFAPPTPQPWTGPLTPPGTPTATVEPTVPPPPGHPTGLPWPPQETPEPPATSPAQPFPTPAFPPLVGECPAALQTIWFPYFPDPDSTPQMQAVLIDQQGQRCGQSDRSLDLAVPKPHPLMGQALIDLRASPDGQWLVADLAYTGSRLLDLSSGASISPIARAPDEYWTFLTWGPDGQHAMISARDELLSSNLASSGSQALDDYIQPDLQAQVSQIVYSPDGRQLADAVVYPPIYQVREGCMVEIGLGSGGRESIVQIPGSYAIA